MIILDEFTEALREILSLTAWEMDTPKSYGSFHLSFMIFGFSIGGFLAYLMRNISLRASNILFLCIGIFLAVSEVYKQLMYELVLEPEPGYRWGIFPFQLCSIPMYLCLIVPFLKQGIVRQSMLNFMMTYNLLGGFIAFFEPSGLLHGHWTLTLHALIWHLLLVFLGVYIALSGRGCKSVKDYKSATVLFLILCAIAFMFNCIFYEISDHRLTNFFIGPADSSIIVFKQISETFGWVVSTALYIPCVCFASYWIYRFFLFIGKKVNKTSESVIEASSKPEKVLVHK